ncbi:uncharacterized protein LOC132745754 [Ruditapes philippinarum]|uniref:uncharacterized protein LOC132745754 n=1 Tax=Ruditapes philippinarum TaxID=129788 RepID=UPI00295BA8C7|nr:uncharacterized protein LOC132745754 [Ruditapes philippinarum]
MLMETDFAHGTSIEQRGKRAGRPRARIKDTNQGVHLDNLTKIKIDQISNLNELRRNNLTLSTVNSRSLRNKSAELLQHIYEEQIDFCVITETWLQPEGDDKTRGELKQDGYNLDDVPRSERKGGGLALLYRDNLKCSRLSNDQFQSFECAEWEIKCKIFTLKIVGIYRPPYSKSHPVTQATFLNEFPELLDRVLLKPEPVVILGDFNLHLDNDDDCYAKRFAECLQSYGLEQHVKTPTHTSGHVLDSIITRKADRLNVSKPVTDYFISDHSFTTCHIEQSRPPLIRKTVISRNWKNVCTSDMRKDLSELKSVIDQSDDTNTLVKDLTEKTTSIVDKHAPMKERQIVCRPDIPWYSSYLKKLKHFKRSIEKIHLKHKSTLTENVYKKVKNHYTREVSAAKSGFYQSKINDAEGNVKKLYNVTSKLLGREKENPLPSYSNDQDLANDFLQYFTDKIKNLRDQLDNTHVDTGHQNNNVGKQSC